MYCIVLLYCKFLRPPATCKVTDYVTCGMAFEPIVSYEEKTFSERFRKL